MHIWATGSDGKRQMLGPLGDGRGGFKWAQLQILVSQSWTWHFDAFGCTLQDQKRKCPVGPATLGSIKMGLHNAQHPAKQRKNSTVCINESNYKVQTDQVQFSIYDSGQTFLTRGSNSLQTWQRMRTSL